MQTNAAGMAFTNLAIEHKKKVQPNKLPVRLPVSLLAINTKQTSIQHIDVYCLDYRRVLPVPAGSDGISSPHWHEMF
jgi:hypothetical protein